jgi:hypothetical protein
MKTPLILLVCLLLAVYVTGQDKKIIISQNGIDSIKIGMTEIDAQKLLNNQLSPYKVPNITYYPQNTALDSTNKYLKKTYTCIYNKIRLILIFYRTLQDETTDFKLVGIMPVTGQNYIETTSGIKLKMTEKELVQLCTNYKYTYTTVSINNFSKTYYITDDTKGASKKLIVLIKNGYIASFAISGV